MASICNLPNGRRRIMFVGADGKRRSIRLGKVPLRQAEAIKVKIEDLVSASITGHAPADETSRWLAALDDMMVGRLASVDLIGARQTLTLGQWLRKHLDGRTDLKPESKRKLEQTSEKLLDYFGGEVVLRKITADNAAQWRQRLLGLDLKTATVKTHVGNAKSMFTAAVERELIGRSPFRSLKGGATAAKNERHVDPGETSRLIDAAPDLRYRLLIGLNDRARLRAAI